MLYPHPWPVWGADLPQRFRPANDRRFVTFFLHNAGGAPCQVSSISCSVPWLEPDWTHGILPEGGLPVPLHLRLQPSQYTAGDHPVQVIVRITGNPGVTLTRTLTVEIPDAPFLWFDAEQVDLGQAYEPVTLQTASGHPLRFLYNRRTIVEAAAGETVRLYPAEYMVDGIRGDLARVSAPGGPTTAVHLPGPLRVTGPGQTVTLRNAGPRAVSARLVPAAAWICIEPETVDLLPGARATVTISTLDDGRYWGESPGTVLVRSRFDEAELAAIAVRRDWQVAGARPVFRRHDLQFPAVPPGGFSQMNLAIANGGDRPLVVRPEGEREGIRIHPGEEGSLPVKVETARARGSRLDGTLKLETNAALPFWRYPHLAYHVPVVGVRLETDRISFGDVRYKEVKQQLIRVRRSDHKRSRLKLAIPADLGDVLGLNGEFLSFRNLQRRPLTVSQSLDLYDLELGDTPIGQVEISGRCLVPGLGVTLPEIRLIPGTGGRFPLAIHDVGGGLDLGRITADQPWCRVRQNGLNVSVAITTDRGDRGTRTVTLLIPSNDFAAPLQEHRLKVMLTPTFRMRVEDLLRFIIGPIWRPISRLIARFKRKGGEKNGTLSD